MFICMTMNLALNNLQKLICHKPKQITNQPTKQAIIQPKKPKVEPELGIAEDNIFLFCSLDLLASLLQFWRCQRHF